MNEGPGGGGALPAQGIDADRRSVILVGIGASAGGIEAIVQLLQTIPPDTGLAFVVIMHLDPGHPSQLVDVLSRATTMPIHEAAEATPVAANGVYVIPPNVLLRVVGGLLNLTPRSEVRGPPMPIDFFFNSLALDARNRSVGIVLSGTGSDGTLGVKAIKEAGGITFAQDQSAQHGGMPRSAIQSQCVDFVLGPPAIATELIRLSKHPYTNGTTTQRPPAEIDPPADREDPYAVLFRLLRSATQIDFTNYKRSTIERRIQRRLLVHRLERLEEYLELVRREPAEVLALQQDLLIHVTRFFRESEAFEAIKAVVFPAVNAQRAAEQPIRIWVPGCSTGEEVYSLAICLLEFLGDSAPTTPIKIFATDISDEVLAQARVGRYLENIVADVSPERLRRFFLKEDSGYQIIKSIRDLCVFARHDMTRDPPFSNLDLISCRNVLIYLGPLLQKRVLPLFHYALKAGRFLLLGESETIGNLGDLYDCVDPGQRLYAAKATVSPITFDFSSGGTVITEAPATAKVTRDVHGFQDLRSEVDRLVLAQYAPAGVVVDDNMQILQFRGQTGAFLAPAPGNASLDLFRMAREGLLVDLRAAIEDARRTGKPARREGLRVRTNHHYLDAMIQVIPLQFAAQQRCFVVLFEENPSPQAPLPQQPPSLLPPPAVGTAAAERQLSQLQQELEATREYLQASIEQKESTNEELKAANEEIISSNEELQSTNEELQTAKEELQASNEELNTVNEELHHRNKEATQLGNDLTNLLRSVNIPIVMVGQDLRIRRFTPSAADVFNLLSSDVGRPIADLKPQLVDVALEHEMAQVLESLAPLEWEARDRQGRWQRVCLRPYRTQQNTIDGVVLSVIDIDTIRKSEQHTREARDYAEAILGTIHIPLAVLDREFRLVAVNAAFCDFFKVTSAETEKRFLRDLGNRQWDIPTLTQLLMQLLSAGDTVKDFVVRHDFPTIGSKIMLVNARRLEQSGPPAILMALEDITERERAAAVLRVEQLREVQKMESVGRLAGGIAHDFNNLLTVVNGYCETLMKRLASDTTSLTMLGAIHAAGTRAASLTQQLLAYSRQQILQPRELDLNQLLIRLEPLLKRLLTEKIRVQLQLSNEQAVVLLDPSQMEQVIMNLCLNANDAMPQGGHLVLETCHVNRDETTVPNDGTIQAARLVRLTVRDDGCGMDAATLARAFEPFFTTKEFGKGSGLGLATVYGIVKQSQGHIEATSQPAQGTTVAIYLPALPPSALTATPLEVARASPPERKTVLIVEDEPAIRQLEVTLLQSLGLQLLDAENGRAALQLCAHFAGTIDLLITDVLMPGMSGHKLASELRAVRPGIKVLYVSGHSEELVRQQGIVIEASAFLQKPFSPAVMLKKVQELLGD